MEGEVSSSLKNPKDEDQVFDYARAILNYGLLALNFENATRQGDGLQLY